MAGKPHPDFLLEELTAEQWDECLEYYDLEPFGPPVDDLRHGMQCAIFIAPHLKRGAKAEPTTYMVRPPKPRELTPEETVDYFRKALGGGVRKP